MGMETDIIISDLNIADIKRYKMDLRNMTIYNASTCEAKFVY